MRPFFISSPQRDFSSLAEEKKAREDPLSEEAEAVGSTNAPPVVQEQAGESGRVRDSAPIAEAVRHG